MQKIYVSQCDDYSVADVDKAVKFCMKDFVGGVKKGSSVLLKPNILIGRSSENVVTTNPEVVRAVARVFKEIGCRVSLGDSPAFGNLRKALDTCGILPVCEEEGIDVVDFDVAKKIDTLSGPISVYKGIDDFDYLVNLPKAKTHGLTGFTGAQKNLFGLVCGMKKSKYHLKYPNRYSFSRMIVSLANAVKPSFNLMDCVVGMEGNGPSAGSPRKLGFIAASESAPYLDFFVSDLLGFKYDEVGTLEVEHSEHGLDVNVNNLNLISNIDPGKLRVKDFKKAGGLKLGGVMSLVKKYVSSRPVISVECINCNRCVENCPADAIAKGLKRPVIDYNKCIRCYCCGEICPSKAIVSRRTLFGKILKL